MTKSRGFWVCLHPEHKAVLEILEDENYDKFEKAEGGYVKLRFASTKERAVEEVRGILERAYTVDPKGERLKETILRLYP